MLIDSHAHLTMFDSQEVAELLKRAVAAGVGGVLAPATNGDDLDAALALVSRFPEQVVVAVGVHPHDAASLDAGLQRRLEVALTQQGVVAVGEIGLDYHYMSSPREDQVKALKWQLDLAEERDLPVVLHNRESWQDLLQELSPREGRLRGVCHSFTEPPDRVRQVMGLGLSIGVSGMVTFKQAHNIRDMARSVEPSQLLVETDSPFLAPVPHRGTTNEPAFVSCVAAALAELLGMAPAQLAALTTANFKRLFVTPEGWPSPDNS